MPDIRSIVTKIKAAFSPQLETPQQSVDTDVAGETLERYRQRCRAEYPTWSPIHIEYMARQRAMANLEDRAEFRREYPVTIEGLRAKYGLPPEIAGETKDA